MYILMTTTHTETLTESIMQHMINMLDSDLDVSTPNLRAASASDLNL